MLMVVFVGIPARANIFVGYYELKLFESFPEPLIYYCYRMTPSLGLTVNENVIFS